MKNNNTIIQFSGAFLMAWMLLGVTKAQAQQGRSIPDKVHHAEPLYNDLVRDLGARKGEKEFKEYPISGRPG